MRTFLVDDDFISVFLTEKLFQREGFGEGLHSFESPEKALDSVLHAISQESVPDVILLDLNMPVLNGWDFLSALQPYEAQLTGRCFIYILTSSLAPADQVRSEEFPLVIGFIHKPLDGIQVQAIHAYVAEHQG
ncbi:response regulator [Hymenobacter mucosus]|uniref:CheY chemotaxis protein or a CheY-like REC (Receiver) domain n=1 Tax=Hymenobacter mucosus TaxID=1411120 RepID=A0A238ZAT1_9BACT|nr:response regulator [Hymenobacter mucosus]SNR80400.1 CheY chemotaxis protein or a CheY-like REC (receiver) domain [Hymenobacter mucosus]